MGDFRAKEVTWSGLFWTQENVHDGFGVLSWPRMEMCFSALPPTYKCLLGAWHCAKVLGLDSVSSVNLDL